MRRHEGPLDVNEQRSQTTRRWDYRTVRLSSGAAKTSACLPSAQRLNADVYFLCEWNELIRYDGNTYFRSIFDVLCGQGRYVFKYRLDIVCLLMIMTWIVPLCFCLFRNVLSSTLSVFYSFIILFYDGRSVLKKKRKKRSFNSQINSKLLLWKAVYFNSVSQALVFLLGSYWNTPFSFHSSRVARSCGSVTTCGLADRRLRSGNARVAPVNHRAVVTRLKFDERSIFPTRHQMGSISITCQSKREMASLNKTKMDA